MKEITYSFVIPHHNTPDLLQRLIDSIPQREDIEIIVVDDNSDDDKKANVSRSDVKTVFIDKEHTKGAGHARNVGMEYVRGKWLLFADADDFYKSNFIYILDEYKDDDIEILFFNVDSVDSDTLQPNENRSKIASGVISQYNGTKESRDILLYMAWAPWRKMQRTSFIKKYGFRFEEVPKGNDVFFTFLTSYFVKKWKVDRRVVYTLTYYRNSITYGRANSYKYKYTLLNFRNRAKFFIFIGHPEWNKNSFRGKYKQSVILYILRALKIKPYIGVKILFYYIFHFLEIEKKSNYYVEVIKKIANNSI